MKDILSSAHRAALEELAWSKLLLALDYDGILGALESRLRWALQRTAAS